MEEIARVYAEALFEVAQDKGKLDEIHDQLGEVADAIAQNRDLQVFLFSPYFSSVEKREELVSAAKRDIEAETRRSLDQIRKEVADLTVLATEKVTRKSLTAEDQRRLVEEALGEVDFSRLSGSEN